ncbi:MAG: hypothetical protein INR71_03455 [Terriglobus roseus]|nr:hypothetical protein [Terriglobus roseus]
MEKSRAAPGAASLRRGLTYSKGGVPLGAALQGRKKRKHYPASWGHSADHMRMRKRVLCVYDGPRRLWKDDMMLDAEFEVRLPLYDQADPTSRSYVTDLDVQTMRRAEALHGTTEEERGEWHEDNVYPIDADFGPDAAVIGA